MAMVFDKISAKGEFERSLTIDMSPSMEKEALGFATMRGKSLEQLFLDYLQTEMRKSRETERQRDVILRIAGTWVDDRSDEEIIADIENSRTPGREVML